MFADRAQSLAGYLDAAYQLAAVDRYPPAFAVLRAALEHHAIDLLLFLGRRYTQLVRNVTDEKWEEWQEARRKGEDWTKDIVDWRRHKTSVTIVRSGLHAKGSKRGPRATALSIYFFILQDYDPLAGHPARQEYLTTGFHDPESFIKLAERNRETYHHSVSWSAVKDNLKVNKLYGTRDLAHLDVHYTFLSAFVHPASELVTRVYDNNPWDAAPRYDHYSSELCLLYILELAAAELSAIERMSRRSPRVPLKNWSEVDNDVSTALQLSSHFWFPPRGQPHEYDRIEESHRRLSKNLPKAPTSLVDPGTLKARSVRYYRDPLRRLIRMHTSWTEMMSGLSFRSPWEHPDARRRM